MAYLEEPEDAGDTEDAEVLCAEESKVEWENREEIHDPEERYDIFEPSRCCENTQNVFERKKTGDDNLNGYKCCMVLLKKID